MRRAARSSPIAFVVLPAGCGALAWDRPVPIEPTSIGEVVRLEYRVPDGSTHDVRRDFHLDALGWHCGEVNRGDIYAEASAGLEFPM